MMYDEPNQFLFTIRFFSYFDISSKISNILTNQETVFFIPHFMVSLLGQPLLPRVCTTPTMKGPCSWPSSGNK